MEVVTQPWPVWAESDNLVVLQLHLSWLFLLLGWMSTCPNTDSFHVLTQPAWLQHMTAGSSGLGREGGSLGGPMGRSYVQDL